MISDKIRELREKRGITQGRLGEILGLSTSTINKYEGGKRTPDLIIAIKMAEYFGVSVDYLCDRKPSMKEKLAYDIVTMLDRKGLVVADTDGVRIKALLKIADSVLEEYKNLKTR